MRTRLSRFLAFTGLAVLVLLSLAFVLIAFDGTLQSISAPVDPADARTDTLQRFEGASVVGPGRIVIENPGYVTGLLAPRKHLDTLYTLLFFIAVILFVIYFRDFSSENPFTTKALSGLRTAFITLAVFYLANVARTAWFNEYVRARTNNAFTYEPPSSIGSMEFWTGLILLRLIFVFKKGLELKGENDLTI